MKIKFIKYTNENNDFHMYFHLFRKAFPRTSHIICNKNRYQDYLEWLYEKNPLGKVICYNAFSADHLVGHYACVPMIWVQGNRTFRALLSLNSAIDPEFQRQGIFSSLAKKTYTLARKLKYDFVYGVSNNNSTHGLRKLGFEVLGPLRMQISFTKQKFINSDPMTNKLLSNKLSEDFLNWRLQRPFTVYHKKGSRIMSSPKNMVINFASKLTNDNVLTPTNISQFKSPLRIFIGSKIQTGFIELPKWIRPRPFNLIFKKLNPNKKINSAMQNWDLDYLDFDLA